LDDGTFGRVYQVKKQSKTYALKVIKPVDRFIMAARQEYHMVKYFEEPLLQVIESFLFKNFYCIVFELLGPNLYEFMKANGQRGYPIGLIQDFASQILSQLALLHSKGITHTDLKVKTLFSQKTFC